MSCRWANYKFFLLFLLYSGALGNYVAVVSACELAWFVGSAEEVSLRSPAFNQRHPPGASKLVAPAHLLRPLLHPPQNFELAPVSWAVAMLLGFIFGFAVGGFALYHLWLACSNKTTIESMERAPAIALDDGRDAAVGGKAKLRDYYELNKVERRRMDKVSWAWEGGRPGRGVDC